MLECKDSEPTPFDTVAARSYALVVAMVGRRRKPGSRFADLLIRNGDDFAGLDGLVRVVAI